MGIEDIQNLKKLREIKTQYGLNPKRKLKLERKILNRINNPFDVLKKRLRGLETEDEFLLFILLIAEIEQVTKLEQKQHINSEKYTVPDYLLGVKLPNELNDKKLPAVQRMFVEVKKCKENELEFNITTKAYQKLRYYSQLYTLPLYFAIKFDSINIKQWFFISGNIIEKFGKKDIRRINNRSQECYTLQISTILKYDLSCLWLNNHISLLKKGTIIEKEYNRSLEKANIFEKKFGALCYDTISLNEKQIRVDLNRADTVIESIAFSTILRKLSKGKRTTIKEGNKTIIKFKVDNNYFIPYYYIILETFLHLRQQFKHIQKESDDSIEYYVNNFSNIDMNLLIYIKKSYYGLVNSGLLTRIRMMPNFKDLEKT